MKHLGFQGLFIAVCDFLAEERLVIHTFCLIKSVDLSGLNIGVQILSKFILNKLLNLLQDVLFQVLMRKRDLHIQDIEISRQLLHVFLHLHHVFVQIHQHHYVLVNWWLLIDILIFIKLVLQLFELQLGMIRFCFICALLIVATDLLRLLRSLLVLVSFLFALFVLCLSLAFWVPFHLLLFLDH